MNYNIAKLRQLAEIDIDKELQSYESPQQYFDKLTDFITGSKTYLADFNALVVVNRPEERERFLKELGKLRDTLSALGMVEVASDMRYLESVVFQNDASVLSGELSVFKLRLENIAMRAASAQIEAQKAEESSSKKIVIAVDDRPAILTSIVKMLEDRYMVMAVSSGEAALRVIEKHMPAVFLLDIEMPGMNGFELARQIRAKDAFKTIPIIFLTSRNTRSDVVMAVKHGGSDYMVKPVDRELLISKIEGVLE